MSRAPRQAKPDDEPGAETRTQPRAVAEGRGHQLGAENARRIAAALTAAGQAIPPDIQALLDEDDAASPTSAPAPAADQDTEA